MDDSTNPVSATPAYRIFRDKHGIPQFSPKRGTQALKDALIYAFPTLETELQLMQAALKKFFDSERGIQIICELPENDLQTSLAKKRDVEISPIQEQKAGLRKWKMVTGDTRPSSRLASRTTSRAPSRTGSRAGSRPSSRASSCARESSVEIGGTGLMTTWSLDSGRELERKKKGPYDPVKRRKVAENRGNACEKHRAAKAACNPLTCPNNKMFGKLPTDMDAAQESCESAEARKSSFHNVNPGVELPNVINIPNVAADVPYQDFVNLPADADVFWDASDFTSNQDISMDFSHLSTSSHVGSWTDASYTDLLSWSPNSSCLTAPDSIQTSFAPTPELPQQEIIADEHISTFNTTKGQIDPSNVTLPVPHNCPMQHYPSLSYPSPSDEPSMQQPLAVSMAQDKETFICNEDPFMGWASKKANQVFDEYNWVLSHVETL